jgi:hypothetical protein
MQIRTRAEDVLKGILKWPLIIAAAVVVLRIANERARRAAASEQHA